MTIDPSIREQTYRYFLQEAPELLQVLEQDLLSLREEYSINKVNNLMRTTHTLKGAAASVGLETIKTVAHSLEDIFKALFNPDVSIDQEVEALLFEAYECLRLPLTAQLSGGQVNDAEILDRTAAVFAQLQEKLGDCFSQEAHIPSSVELGFDMTQSIFELGVTQRLEELATAIALAQPQEVATSLRSQAEVFLGLAESLNLPGFGAIAQAAIAAMEAHPEQVETIALTALVDFQAGRKDVLAGDRSQGGQLSPALQQLAGFTTSSTQQVVNSAEPAVSHDDFEGREDKRAGEFSPILISPQDQPDFVAQESAIPSSVVFATSVDDSELSLSELHNSDSASPLLEMIWGGQAVLDPQTSAICDLASTGSTLATSPDQEQLNQIALAALSSSQHLQSMGVSKAVPDGTAQISVADWTSLSDDEPEVKIETTLSQHLQTDRTSSAAPQKGRVSLSSSVRINVEHLEHLNYSIGELLTNHNRQSLQNEQMQAAVRKLLARLEQHQHLLGQLQDWSDSLFSLPEQRRTAAGQDWQSHFRFDSLELDQYNESQILIQSILEDTVQLAEATDALDLFMRQSTQTVEKQRRLLTSTRDTMMEARMLPLGDIFGRFPRLLQQLEIKHNKPVALELRGTEVLVDKLVAEKLYDPLLHLVRNAFDHGIESATVRQQRGKPSLGQIKIFAYHQGGYLVIEVCDDGQGLDFEKIRQLAVERQFVSQEEASSLNEAQLTDLLFEAGFTTASQVSDLSGRGVGLDVVRAHLQALQGSVVVSSEPRQGTIFRLRIPLSLTIAKLILVQAGNRIYALLANTIEQFLIPQPDQIQYWKAEKILRWGNGTDERLIPIHDLATVLAYSSLVPEPLVSQPKQPFVTKEPVRPVILIRCQDDLLGLEVDQLLEEQELVIRPLGSMIGPPSYVYGASIMADGRLTLVIDGAALMQYSFDIETDSSANNILAGSTTRLISPSKEPRQLPAQTHAALPALAPEPNFRARQKKIVLVVDDSITVRQSLALTLQKAGYQVLQAKDGYDAIQELRHKTGIQLVICDIEMPRMNGFEFLKYHQQDPALANIPVIILTSRSGEKHRLIANQLGALDYITKPFLEQNLLVAMADVLEKNIPNSVPV